MSSPEQPIEFNSRGRRHKSRDYPNISVRWSAEQLRHGKTYRVVLRSGLPTTSAIGEAIEKPVVLNVYVRDRSPLVRFSGDRFVLPGAARDSVAVSQHRGRVPDGVSHWRSGADTVVERVAVFAPA